MSARLSFRIDVDVNGSPMLYRAFRDQIEKCVNSFSNLRFVELRELAVPDRYSLTDPDKPPGDFK